MTVASRSTRRALLGRGVSSTVVNAVCQAGYSLAAPIDPPSSAANGTGQPSWAVSLGRALVAPAGRRRTPRRLVLGACFPDRIEVAA